MKESLFLCGNWTGMYMFIAIYPPALSDDQPIQTPWAYPYSKWYMQYPQYLIGALTAASLLQVYTLSD